MHNYVYSTYGPKNLKWGMYITSTLLSEYTQCHVIGNPPPQTVRSTGISGNAHRKVSPSEYVQP